MDVVEEVLDDDDDPRRDDEDEDDDGFLPIPNESSLSDGADLDLDLDFPNLNFFIFFVGGVGNALFLYIWLIFFVWREGCCS